MPPLPLPEPDVKAIAAYIHSVAAKARGTGRTAARPSRRAQHRRRRRRARGRRTSPRTARAAIRRPATCRDWRRAFPSRCSCRTPGSRAVAGGAARRPRRAAADAAPARVPKPVTVAVTLANGQRVEGRLDRIDDFIVIADPGRRRPAHVPARRRRAAGADHRSAGRTQAALDEVDRQGHARRDGLSGDTEMTLTKRILLTSSLVVGPGVPDARQDQGGLDPASILKPLADSWPTYSGDYSGRRYSALTQINQTTVKGLSAGVGREAHGRPAERAGRRPRRWRRTAAVAAARRSSSAARAATSSRPPARRTSRARSCR